MSLVSVIIHSNIGLPPCGLKVKLAVVWCPPSGRGGRSERVLPRRDCSAFYCRLQFCRRLQWRGSCKTSSSKFQRAIENSEAARALATAEEGWLTTKRENGLTPIIEIVEALGIVLPHAFLLFLLWLGCCRC